MPDGQVGLILDVGGLIGLARQTSAESTTRHANPVEVAANTEATA
jgi:hypothetical protein